MKKVVKIIGAAGAVALAAALVPFRFKKDKEAGEFELGGLLWNLKKQSGEEEDTYTMELLPFIDKKESEEPIDAPVEVEVEVAESEEEESAPAEETEAPAAEEPVEEPFAETETPNEVVVEAEEPAAEPVEETEAAPEEQQ